MDHARGMWSSRRASTCMRQSRSLSVTRTATMTWEMLIDYSCPRPHAGHHSAGVCAAARSTRVPGGRPSWIARHHD